LLSFLLFFTYALKAADAVQEIPALSSILAFAAISTGSIAGRLILKKYAAWLKCRRFLHPHETHKFQEANRKKNDLKNQQTLLCSKKIKRDLEAIKSNQEWQGLFYAHRLNHLKGTVYFFHQFLHKKPDYILSRSSLLLCWG